MTQLIECRCSSRWLPNSGSACWQGHEKWGLTRPARTSLVEAQGLHVHAVVVAVGVVMGVLAGVVVDVISLEQAPAWIHSGLQGSR